MAPRLTIVYLEKRILSHPRYEYHLNAPESRQIISCP